MSGSQAASDMKDTKTVYDPIHGSITVSGAFLDLMDRHEIQRMRQIKQLGLSNIVFPGANHTRFEHSMGVFHLAGRMADVLELPADEGATLRAAAMLHDVCHPPFSHTLESTMEAASGCDHMEMSRRLVFGEVPSHLERDEEFFGGVEPLSVLLEDNGISPEDVCDLIINPASSVGWFDGDAQSSRKSYFVSKDYAHQIIHGPVDADQMDYLMRDAHYTGIVQGAIDTERILSQMQLHNDKVVLRKGGITAAEGLMVSRSLMYSTVYYHKTVKVMEAMLRRAVELSSIDLSQLYLMTDSDLVSALLSEIPDADRGDRMCPADLMRMVINRRPFRKCVIRYSIDTDLDYRSQLARYASKAGRHALEQEIAAAAGVDPTRIIVDIPSESTLLSKIKIGKTDVSIIDSEDKVRSITKYSSVSKALQSREAIDWCVLVSAPKDDYESVSKAARRVLSFDDSDRF